MARKKNITLKEVAEKAGVSPSTVSRALNNPDIVDTETLELVRGTAELMGYRYKRKSADTGDEAKIGNIAIMVPDILNPQMHYFIKEIDYCLRHEKYVVSIFVFNNDSKLIEKQSNMIVDKGYDGCIMLCLRGDEESEALRRLTEGVPTVTFQSDVENVDCVNTTDGEGTMEMLEKLYEWGHKKIGFIAYSANLSLTERRVEAYREFHRIHNLPLRDDYICFGDATLQSGYDQACRLLSLEDRPTAIHCFNSFTAMGVYIAARDRNIDIPKEISVSAFDDTPVSTFFTPTISSVAQPTEAIARTLVNILLERIRTKNKRNWQTIVFPTTLVLRQSTTLNKDNEK